MINRKLKIHCIAVFILTVFFTAPLLLRSQALLDPHAMKQSGHVGDRFVSFNVEAVEVTGGRFWKPSPTLATSSDAPRPTSSSDPYEYREPIDLGNAKLRKLASALSPSYMRVSGTWRNSVYFQDNDDVPLKTPPVGFKSVMTRHEWKGVIEFSHAVGANIVASMTISDGVRDADGNWTPMQAKSFFDYTRQIGGKIVAAEFMNEPTFAAVGAAPKGYNAESFAKDIRSFRSFLTAESPNTLLLGPGSIGEGIPMVQGLPMPKMLSLEDMLKASGPAFDAFSYHFYTTLSQRCVGKMGLSWEKVLTSEYLDRNIQAEEYYAGLRNKYLPGKAIWLTETGEAGCGGNRWASSFVDAFRFTDQLGAMAQRNVQTVIVNTLASSDYGLLDENDYTPRPDYWIAVIWKRLMGQRVLAPAFNGEVSLRAYAQCLNGVRGGVAVVLLNLDQSQSRSITTRTSGVRYTLTASSLLSKSVDLNGRALEASAEGSLPKIEGVAFKTGTLEVPPASITFMAFPRADNLSCSLSK